MEKAYIIKDVKFDNGYLIVTFDDQFIRLRLEEISEKLAGATEQERQDFRVSPSGYGIHWNMLDEDLSVNGLLKATDNHLSGLSGKV